MHEIDKLGWLCIKNKQVLCARSKGKDTYYIPGGKRELGEGDIEALCREINEELSVALKPETIEFAKVFKAQAHEKSGGTLVKLTCYFAEFLGEIKAAAEIEEIVWINNKNQVRCSSATAQAIDWLHENKML